MPRLVAALPVILLLYLAPLLFDPVREIFTVITAAYLSARMPATKVLALCMGRGPLAPFERAPLPLFGSLMIFPIVPAAATAMLGKPRSACGSGQLLSHLLGRWAAAAITTCMAAAWGAQYPIFLHAALVCGMVMVVGSVMDVTALTCQALYGLDIAQHFDAPFRATSLADFWGRRWNVSQSLVLKGLVFDPICEGRLLPLPLPLPRHAQHSAHAQRAQRADPVAHGACSTGSIAALPDEPPPAGHPPASGSAHPVQRSSGDVSATNTPRGSTAGSGGLVREGSGADPRVASVPTGPQLASGGGGGSEPARPHDKRAITALATDPAAAADSHAGTSTGSERAAGPEARSSSGGCSGSSFAAAHCRGGSQRRKALAMLATFTFSGLEHELFYAYVRRRPCWLWLAFFVLHGLLLLGERRVAPLWRDYVVPRMRLMGRPARMPSALSTLLTLLCLEVSAAWLFYPVLLEPAVVERVVHAGQQLLRPFMQHAA